MRRDEFFQMRSLTKRRYTVRVIDEQDTSALFSHFCNMDSQKDAPTFSRHKGASVASRQRLQCITDKIQ